MTICQIPRFHGIRRGDRQDIRGYFEAFGAALAQIAKRDGPEAARRVQIEVPGLINGPEPVHATSGLINGPAGQPHTTFVTAPTGAPQCPPQTAGDSAHEPDPGCEPRKNCGDDALPFRSRGNPNFPVIGNGDFAQSTLVVGPRVQEVTPHDIYWAAFDANNGYARIAVAELVSAVVGTEEQLLGPGMVASVFSDVKDRIPVTWKSFTPQLPLELTFGHPFPDTVHMQVHGVLWSEVKRR